MNTCMKHEYLPGICMVFAHNSTVHEPSDSFVSADQMFSPKAPPAIPIGNFILAFTGVPTPFRYPAGLYNTGKSGKGLMYAGGHHGHKSRTLVPSVTGTVPQAGSRKAS